jgi:hypothetical protein
MAYTDIDDPTIYFNTKLYAGTGSSNAITGVGFQPDWVWVKNRTGTNNHRVANSVLGSAEVHAPNIVNIGPDSSYFSSFNSDGFTVGTAADPNVDGGSFVSWNWKAGTSFTNDASSTSVGTIESAGSVSTASGFSIVSYTGTGTAGTIAHGLGKLPKMIIAKNLSDAENWVVYFLDTSIAYNNVNNYLELNTTIASTGDSGARWGAYANYSTTTFGVGTDDGTNKSGSEYVAYVFSDIQGYSKIGKYTGNGNADGTFVYTGFKPAFFLVKRTDSTPSWTLLDNKRDPFNVTTERLFPNENVAGSVGVNANTDFLSNGVKIRVNHNNFNNSGGSYIYMAFAESPFVTSTGIPATAR